MVGSCTCSGSTIHAFISHGGGELWQITWWWLQKRWDNLWKQWDIIYKEHPFFSENKLCPVGLAVSPFQASSTTFSSLTQDSAAAALMPSQTISMSALRPDLLEEVKNVLIPLKKIKIQHDQIIGKGTFLRAIAIHLLVHYFPFFLHLIVHSHPKS